MSRLKEGVVLRKEPFQIFKGGAVLREELFWGRIRFKEGVVLSDF